MAKRDGKQAGFRLGKYELIKRLAAGGMAEIFLARASGLPGFQKMVVIKRILPVLASKGDFLEMFLNEARIAATLQHANVVQMYDVGVVDGNYFIAMEYLHGEDVRSIQTALRRARQRLPLEHALHMAIGVCAGLHYAHEKIGYDGQPLKIVHRDVSPQNVIVTHDGAVKLLDFGVAKATSSLNETACGVVKGKIPYMSPEQCVGLPVDRRSDLYSLGILLFELTLARRLYGGGGSEFETLKRIVEQPVPLPSDLDPSYDPRLEQILMRALAKQRDQRYQTARELQVDLEDLARERRMYMSAIALQQFMEKLFGRKAEAWREAAEAKRTQTLAAAPGEYDLEIVEEPARDEVASGDELDELVPDASSSSSTSSLPPPLPPPRMPDQSSASWPPPLARSPQRKGPPLPLWIGAAALLALALPLAARKASRDRPEPPLARAPAPPSSGETAVPAAAAAAPRAVETAPSATRPAPLATRPARSSRVTAAHVPRASSSTQAPRSPRAGAPVSGAPASNHGDLLLASTPWCEVTVDGAAAGPTPLKLRLPAGLHRVRLSNAEFHVDRTIEVSIVPQQTVRKRLDLSAR